jgi:hypothetical protein
MEAQFLARLGAGGAVDVGDDGARTGDDAAGRDRCDGVHLGEAEDDTARKRHGLAVIAGACAARGDWDAVAMAGGEHADNFGLALRRDDEVSGDMVELALEHRAVPVEVAALLLDDFWIVLDPQPGKVGFQRGQVHHAPIRSSSSA